MTDEGRLMTDEAVAFGVRQVCERHLVVVGSDYWYVWQVRAVAQYMGTWHVCSSIGTSGRLQAGGSYGWPRGLGGGLEAWAEGAVPCVACRSRYG
eukprot:481906-Prymnesium_polylepis.1